MSTATGTHLNAAQIGALSANASALEHARSAPTSGAEPAALPGVSQEHYVKEYDREKAKGAAADGEYMTWLYEQASRARPAESSAIHNQFKANKAAAAAPAAAADPLPNMTAYLRRCTDRCRGQQGGKA